MVSIMPGIENFAPERTETSSGFSVEPSVAPAAFSSLRRCAAISVSIVRRELGAVARNRDCRRRWRW